MDIRKKIEKYRKVNIARNTSGERAVKELLEDLKLPFKQQYPIRTKTSFILIDFCLLKYKIAIEIDGNYMTKDNKKYEEKREKYIKSRGLTLYRFKNYEVLENSDNFRIFKHKLLEIFKRL